MGDIITTDSVATEQDSDTSNETMISPHVVSKHNDLVGASYRLSVAEQRLILLAIAKIDSRKPMPNGIVVTAHDFMSRYTVNKSDAYTQLQDAAKQLFNAKITSITGTGKGRAIHEVRWVERCTYVKGEGRVELLFSTTVKPYLSRLIGHYTSYDLWRVSGIESTYSFRLFEMLMQYKSKGWLYITVEELRRRLQLGEAYERFSNLRSRVIDASVKELRNKCSMELDYELIKEHRTVKAIKFNFRLLDQMTLQFQSGSFPPENLEQDMNDIIAEPEG
jgi:plasmid replication initiation protein